MIKQFVEKNVTLVAIFIFMTIFISTQITKPSIFYNLDGSTNGLPVAAFQFMIFGTNKIAVEDLSAEVGNLFSGYRGTVSGVEIASSVWNNQETNDVFVEGNDIPVYSYINSHLIQFVEE